MQLLFHQPYEPFAYALDTNNARLVLLTSPRKFQRVNVHYGDRYVEKPTDSLVMRNAGFDGHHDVFVADVPVPTSRLKYIFEALPADASEAGATTNEPPLWFGEGGISEDPEVAGVFQLAYLCRQDVFRVPDWVNRSVCYQIFPERFENGNPSLTPARAVSWDAKPTRSSMHGGDLAGITQRLTYLKALGVNLVYMTPVFKAGSNHKYDTTDYKQIDPQFGSKEDLRELVAKAHELGIKVVLDAVFNHAGMGFAPFQDVVAHGRKSQYFDWFFIDGDTVDTKTVNYETFGTKNAYMPKLNVANPEVEAFLLDVATYWIRECDIDGWRLDVANEVSHVFWRRFRDAVKAEKADALIIGEVWHNSMPWLFGDQFDSVMNYVFRDACLKFFVTREWDATQFAEAIVRLLYLYPDAPTRAMFNLLGSHDTERILTLAEEDVRKVALAFTFAFTFPGIPMLYYGDEIGMVGGQDPDCRHAMIWDEAHQDLALQATVANLAHLRTSEPALCGSRLDLLDAREDLVVFERISDDGKAAIRVAINVGETPVTIPVVAGEVLFHAGKTVAASTKELGGQSAVVWRVARNESASDGAQ